MKKRIIFVNRYYKPDHSATSQLLTDLAISLQEKEFDIHIITSRLLYSNAQAKLPPKEQLDGVDIHRVRTTAFGRNNIIGRSIDYFSFYIFSFIAMLKICRKNDVIVAKTDPPLISIIAALACSMKKGKLINWLQDVFPEVGRQLNIKILTINVLYNALKWLRNKSLRLAHKNIVISEGMQDKMIKENINQSSIAVIHNWVVGDVIPIQKVDNKLAKSWNISDKFIVGYSGNLGRAHDYQSILEAIVNLQENTHIVFLFIGGGIGYEHLSQKAKELNLKNIIFKPYQDISELSYSLSLPDIHLLSLEERLEGFIVPSKFYGIVAAGRPMILIGNKQGSLGQLIETKDVGKVVPCSSPNELTQAIQTMLASEADLAQLSNNTINLHQAHFSRSIAIKKWTDILEEI